MKKLIMLSFALWTLLVPAFTQAQTNQNKPEMITVDPNDLDPATLAKLKAKQAETDFKTKVESYGTWVGIGKEVGVAVDEGLTAVTKHATAIADTRLGKVTMFIIAYKVIGQDIVQISLGIILWVIITIMFIISFSKNCLGKKIKNTTYQEDGKTIKAIKEDYVRPDEDSMLAHAGLYAVAIGICCLVMFV